MEEGWELYKKSRQGDKCICTKCDVAESITFCECAKTEWIAKERLKVLSNLIKPDPSCVTCQGKNPLCDCAAQKWKLIDSIE